MKHRVKNSEDMNDIDSSCASDESEDGKSGTSHNDQDSDVSFEIDNDEEIDAAEIEEEDWVDDIKKKHQRSHRKDGKWEDEMLEDDSKKNEMKTGDENRNITEWEMVDQSCWMEPRTQLKIQDQQITW